MKKKGFTLIELLGVIILLGVIALIIYPTVGRVLNDSREDTLLNSGRGIVKTFRQLYIPYVGKEMYYDFQEKRLLVSGEEVTDEFLVKGELPEGGYIKSNMNGDISMYIYKKGYCIYKSSTAKDVSLRKIGDDSSLCRE